MSNSNRAFKIIEVENGWVIRDETREPGAMSSMWVARDLGDLGKVLTVICSPITDEEDKEHEK